MKEQNFRFRKGYYNIINDMTDKEAGEFIKAVCAYAFDGKEYNTKNGKLHALFMYIQDMLDEEKTNIANGRRGGIKSAQMRKNKVPDVLVIAEMQPPKCPMTSHIKNGQNP